VERNDAIARARLSFIACEQPTEARTVHPMAALSNPVTVSALRLDFSARTRGPRRLASYLARKSGKSRANITPASIAVSASAAKPYATASRSYGAPAIPKASVGNRGRNSPRGRRVDVLVVEDDDGVRELLHSDLSDAGLAVVSVATAEDGLLVVADEASHPAVLVTDVNLGAGMDGIEFSCEARRLWPAVTVVTMTGDERNLHRMPQEDRSLCFLKPFPTARLVRAVEMLLRHRGARRPTFSPRRSLRRETMMEIWSQGAP